MAYKQVLDDVRSAVALKQPGRIPAFACSEEFDVKWYGKYTYDEVCQDGARMAEVWIAAIEEFDYDWAWLQIDDCYEFEPLGIHVMCVYPVLVRTEMFTQEVLERMPKETGKRFIEADRFVAETLKALEHGEHHVVVPRSYRGVVVLKTLFPKLMGRKIGAVKLRDLTDLRR